MCKDMIQKMELNRKRKIKKTMTKTKIN